MKTLIATLLICIFALPLEVFGQAQQGPADPPPCEQNQQRICATLTYQNKAVVATTTPATLPDQIPPAQTNVPHVDFVDNGSTSQLGEEQVRDSQQGSNAFAPVSFATRDQMLNNSEMKAIVTDPKLQRNSAILVGGGLAATAGAIGLAGSGLATMALTVLSNMWATYFFPIMYNLTMSTCELCQGVQSFAEMGEGGGAGEIVLEAESVSTWKPGLQDLSVSVKQGGQRVGGISAYAEGDTAVLDMMHMKEEFRDAGLGTVAYQKWEAGLPGSVTTVVLTPMNADSARFFIRQGFQETGTGDLVKVLTR